jgi:hypothetical protein
VLLGTGCCLHRQRAASPRGRDGTLGCPPRLPDRNRALVMWPTIVQPLDSQTGTAVDRRPPRGSRPGRACSRVVTVTSTAGASPEVLGQPASRGRPPTAPDSGTAAPARRGSTGRGTSCRGAGRVRCGARGHADALAWHRDAWQTSTPISCRGRPGPRIPPMTKSDLANFDQIVTDRASDETAPPSASRWLPARRVPRVASGGSSGSGECSLRVGRVGDLLRLDHPVPAARTGRPTRLWPGGAVTAAVPPPTSHVSAAIRRTFRSRPSAGAVPDRPAPPRDRRWSEHARPRSSGLQLVPPRLALRPGGPAPHRPRRVITISEPLLPSSEPCWRRPGRCRWPAAADVFRRLPAHSCRAERPPARRPASSRPTAADGAT